MDYGRSSSREPKSLASGNPQLHLILFVHGYLPGAKSFSLLPQPHQNLLLMPDDEENLHYDKSEGQRPRLRGA